MPRTRLRGTKIKRAGLTSPSFLFAECRLEDCDQRIVLRLGQRVTFRIDKLQAAAVIEITDLNFVIA
jgi:hypothetical protein